MPARHDANDLAHVYGMVENIDDNVGRLLAKLDQLKLSDRTIVWLFSDNGCQHHNGYNAGLRGWKGSVYEGGIHQFCFVRWPGHLEPGKQIKPITSVIDITPTLLDICGVNKPAGVQFDGLSMVPLFHSETNHWPDRYLFFQWHRGTAPDRYRNFAVRSQEWKLVQPTGADGEHDSTSWRAKMDFQLFAIADDPYEMHNVGMEHLDIVDRLKAAYDQWFNSITNSHDFGEPGRIYIGDKAENPTLLTRQDWRGPQASWNPDGVGYWELRIMAKAQYDITLRFDPAEKDCGARLDCSDVSLQEPIKIGTAECVFKNVLLPAGNTRLEATLHDGAKAVGVKYVELKRLD